MKIQKKYWLFLAALLLLLVVLIGSFFLRKKVEINDGSKIAESLTEWWYFDGNLEDGTVFTVTWGANKLAGDGRLRYPIEAKIRQPDGEIYSKRVEFSPEQASAALQNCDLQYGKNSLRGDKGRYIMHLDLGDLVMDFEIKEKAPSYSGKLFDDYFGRDWRVGWLVAIPKGEIVGTMALAGQKKAMKGWGYHDHNWFDLNFSEYGRILDHRYWGRAFFDDYTLIFNYNVAKKEYGPLFFESLYLAKGNQILVDYSEATQRGEKKNPALILTRGEERSDPQTGAKVYDKLNLKYKDRNGIDLELDLKNLGDIHTLLPSAEMESQYTRYKAGAILKIKRDGKEEVLESEGMAEFRD